MSGRRGPSESDLAMAITCPECGARVGEMCLKLRGAPRQPKDLPPVRMTSSHQARVFDAQVARRKGAVPDPPDPFATAARALRLMP